MSKTHFSGDRKRQANQMADVFPRIYRDYWGENTTCRDFQAGVHYNPDDAEKSLAEIHDIMGADRLILNETELGSMPIFAEEKSRTFKREKLDKSYYNRPFDEDLALTTEYHNRKNQSKHTKHMAHKDGYSFIPTVLSFLVYEADTLEPIRAYLIDYHKLLNEKDTLDYTENTNASDGNTTHYISQMELIERDLVIHSWTNDGWTQ